MGGLRYGSVMCMTDQDLDGSHIKGLLMNMFHHWWPDLCKVRESFLQGHFWSSQVEIQRKERIHRNTISRDRHTEVFFKVAEFAQETSLALFLYIFYTVTPTLEPLKMWRGPWNPEYRGLHDCLFCFEFFGYPASSFVLNSKRVWRRRSNIIIEGPCTLYRGLGGTGVLEGICHADRESDEGPADADVLHTARIWKLEREDRRQQVMESEVLQRSSLHIFNG